MLKALYVDDDEDIGTIVELCLELDQGFEVKYVSSGSEALTVTADWQPDVVLLDYMMPEMDGPATYRALKADRATETVPVIFVTARSMQSDISALQKLGATGIISKPFNPTMLATDIRRLLSSGSRPEAGQTAVSA